MSPRTLLLASAASVALLLACGCADQRNPGEEPPVLGPSDSTNATVASANAAPLSASPATPLPHSTQQPSMPAIDADASGVTAAGIPKLFSSVTVTFTDHAAELGATEPRLTPADVEIVVEQEMAARHLLAPGTKAPPLAITIADFTSTAGSARVLGFTPRDLLLIGDVTVVAAAGRATIDVHARVRVRSRDNSGSSQSLEPLFRRFAQLVVADLQGVEPP